jgi:DNA repair protein RadC
MIPLLKDLPHEECWVIYLNTANRLIAKERITSGGTNSTVVDIKIILKSAMSKLASSIILVHNHPSGSRHPGEHDKAQTKRLLAAASSCDIELIDHIIIAGNNYFSFLDEGLI